MILKVNRKEKTLGFFRRRRRAGLADQTVLPLLQPITDVDMEAGSQNHSLHPKMISADEYIEQRLNDQISWYDRKSGTSQLWFKRLRFAEIVASAIMPASRADR